MLRVDDSEARFFVEGGNAYAQLAGGNKIPLYDRDGAPLDSARAEDGGTALVVPVSPDSDASTYGFFGLPKYKGIASDGEVVHYTVEERFVDQRGQGDYVISSTAGDYLIGERHFHDEQTYRIANRRAGTTEVTFYKEWNDVYVNEALQRPDIALTLYQVSAETEREAAAGGGLCPLPVAGGFGRRRTRLRHVGLHDAGGLAVPADPARSMVCQSTTCLATKSPTTPSRDS